MLLTISFYIGVWYSIGLIIALPVTIISCIKKNLKLELGDFIFILLISLLGPILSCILMYIYIKDRYIDS